MHISCAILKTWNSFASIIDSTKRKRISILVCMQSFKVWGFNLEFTPKKVTQSVQTLKEQLLEPKKLALGNRTCRLKAEETCSHSHQCPVRPWSSLAMPRCQRFSWPLFGARPDERGGEEKSPTKTQKNESFRKQASTNLKDSRSNTSLKVVYTFL